MWVGPSLAWAVGGRERQEVVEPARCRPRPAEEHGGAVGRGHRGEVGLCRTAPAREAGCDERVGTAGRLRRVGALDPECGDQRVAFQVGRQPLVTVVEHETGGIALPELDRLGTVLPAVGQAEPAEQVFGLRPGAGVDGELDEREAARLDRLGRAGQLQARAGRGVESAAQRLLEPEQGPHGVDGGGAGIGLAEDVVEDLERQRPPIAGGDHPVEEPGQVKAALPREAAVVATPLQDVHGQEGGVGELEEEELVRGDRADAVKAGASGEDVEAVEADTQRGMAGGLDDPPGVLVVVHVPAPRQGFVGDADAVLLGDGGQLVQLLAGQAVVVDGQLRDAGADEQQGCAEQAGQLELAPGPAEVVGETVGWDRFEVPEGLVQLHREPQVLDAAADLRR